MSLRRLLFAAGSLFAFLLATPLAVQAQTGSIRGTVTASATGEPVPGARVQVVATTTRRFAGAGRGFVATRGDGTYTLTDVPAGQVSVRVANIGYLSQTATLEVPAGQTVVLDFQLSPSVLTLDAVVVTALGEQSAREVSNALASVNVEQLMEAAPQLNLSEALLGQAPSVTITQPSGTTGSGYQIKIRGNSSINLSNTPLVVVDGARIDNDNAIGPGVGGQDGSRLNDINPADIERVEIVRGPSASTLYGTAAAAGVIQVFTKKGRKGSAPEFSFRSDFGANVKSTYEFSPNLWNPLSFGFGFDTLYTMNLLEEPDALGQYGSPFRSGFIQSYAGSVRGGTEDVTYYVSAEFQDEEGTLPNNRSSRYYARGNFNISPNPTWDLQASVGYTSNFTSFPDNDNNGFGYIGVGQIGFPWNAVIMAPDPNTGGSPILTCPFAIEFARLTGDPLADFSPGGASNQCPDAAGFGGRTFEDVSTLVNDLSIERMTGSATFRVRPTDFWSNRLTLGYDIVDDRTALLTPVNPDRPFGDQSTGRRSLDTETERNLSMDYSGSLNFTFGDLGTVTSYGVQYAREVSEISACDGEEFTAGATTCSDAVTTFGRETYVENKTLGVYIQEQLSWRDRLFVTPAVRFDENSAFGANFDLQVYPKVGVSAIAIDQPIGPLDQLKLRGAWGRSGKAPGNTASFQTFNSRGFVVGFRDVLGVTPAQPGNAELSPEIGEEIEFGFDAGLFNNRIGLEASYYIQKTTDVLVTRPLAPSLGFPNARWDNLGRMDNKGLELALNAAAFTDPNFRWDMTIIFSTNSNEIKELDQFVPLSFSSSQRHQEGFPFGSYFSEKITLDASGDPMVVPVDIALDTLDGVDDDHQFLGQPTPEWEGSFTSTVNFLKYFTLYAFLDFKGGHQLFNSTTEFRCGFLGGGENGGVCPEMFETDAGGEYTDRAKIIQFASSIDSQDPYIEDAKFLKLRSVSLKFQLPDSWARAIHVKRASFSFAGYNLKTWTGYSGADPEINNFGTNQVSRADFLTLPPQRRFIGSFSVTF